MHAWFERHRFTLAVTPLIPVWLHLLIVFLTEAQDDWHQWMLLVLLQAGVLFLAERTFASKRVPEWIPISLIVVDYLLTALLYPLLLFAVRFNPTGGWAG